MWFIGIYSPSRSFLFFWGYKVKFSPCSVAFGVGKRINRKTSFRYSSELAFTSTYVRDGVNVHVE